MGWNSVVSKPFLNVDLCFWVACFHLNSLLVLVCVDASLEAECAASFRGRMNCFSKMQWQEQCKL